MRKLRSFEFVVATQELNTRTRQRYGWLQSQLLGDISVRFKMDCQQSPFSRHERGSIGRAENGARDKTARPTLPRSLHDQWREKGDYSQSGFKPTDQVNRNRLKSLIPNKRALRLDEYEKRNPDVSGSSF